MKTIRSYVGISISIKTHARILTARILTASCFPTGYIGSIYGNPATVYLLYEYGRLLNATAELLSLPFTPINYPRN